VRYLIQSRKRSFLFDLDCRGQCPRDRSSQFRTSLLAAADRKWSSEIVPGIAHVFINVSMLFEGGLVDSDRFHRGGRKP